jgi:hypothetical protein
MLNTLQLNRLRSPLLLQLAVALPVALSAMPAFAHIDVDMGGTHKSRVAGGYDIKAAPCGVADAPRGMNVYKYKPGATINIKVVENIPHPGYFRISFDNDGDDDFVIPTGTAGEHGDCGGNENCGPGKEDFCSNDTVLVDNLDLHPAGESKTYTWSVTLPNVECTNCTLQIIQMMNDFAPFHTPAEYPDADIYYHCIDLELSNDAPESTDTPVENNGMSCKSDASAGAAGASGAAGSSGAAGAADGAGGAGGAAGTPAANGGSGAEPAAAAGSAAPASGGSAGAKAAASGGSAAPNTSSGAAGAKAPTTGSTSSPQGAAGKPAATSTSSGSAGTTSPEASEPEPESTEESGGCQAAPGSAGGLFAPALLGLITLGLRSYRRRRAA